MPAEVIAIIAGTGTLPVLAAQALCNSNRSFFVLSLFPEENATAFTPFLQMPEALIAQPFYKVGAIKKELAARGTTHVVFLGKVDKRLALKKISYDWEFAKLAAQLLYKTDSAIMDLLVANLEKDGLKVLKQRDVLPSLFTSPGIVCGSPLSPERARDVELGLAMAHSLSKHDIGQTVVVKNQMVLAVEAIEGTDECIARGIALGTDGVVVCKTAQPSQNPKYDIPTIGPATLQAIKTGNVAVIAWHAQRTMIIDLEQCKELALAKGITLICQEALYP